MTYVGLKSGKSWSSTHLYACATPFLSKDLNTPMMAPL